ncbi:hypothetical protein LTR36_010849 [Oleoguttula mirabilis]|uniref:DUF1917-domain-containing protein n=1 Tax=Oleoguttula mirabilis TaxID=1507867 RepID=A0AAV9J3T0_9PEZI|nr:hypothetical protein LTR36_010849 [Oleoguttula mirabilis]
MAEMEWEWVDGDGWISDESSFYGDAKMQRELERKLQHALKRGYDETFAHLNAKRVKLERETEASPTATTEVNPSEDVMRFLKTRPQVAAMREDDFKCLQPAKRLPTPDASNEEAAEMLDDRHFEGHRDAWQQNETVKDFLRRLPVDDPKTGLVGPWLWVGNPKISRRLKDHLQKTDTHAFIEGASALFEAFTTQKDMIEAATLSKVPATITKNVKPYKEQLEDALISLAVQTATTCGKWMFFPAPDDLPRTWRLIAEATAAGKLGPTSKVATHDPAAPKPERVICVYTYDFTDERDVRRVLDELVELGLCSAGSARGIFYKCDAWTYLDLKSDNQYKIKASLYSSKEMLNSEAASTGKSAGPMARFKKPNGTIDAFLTKR